MKVVGYARVSTADQSLDIQIEKIKRHCNYSGFEIPRIYTDTASGKNTDREEFQKMVSDIEINAHGAEAIVVWKLDRIGRSLKNLIDLVEWMEDKSMGLICIDNNIDTTTNEGRLFFNIMGSFAEYERTLINERTALGRAAAMANGTKFGRPVVDVDVDDVRSQIAQGIPKTTISTQLGISRSTLYRRIKK